MAIKHQPPPVVVKPPKAEKAETLNEQWDFDLTPEDLMLLASEDAIPGPDLLPPEAPPARPVSEPPPDAESDAEVDDLLVSKIVRMFKKSVAGR